MDVQLENVIFIYIVTVIFLISLIIYKKINNGNASFFQKTVFTCNISCTFRFLMYILMSFLAPKYWIQLVIISFIFEIVEICNQKLKKSSFTRITKAMFVNLSGIFIGKYLNINYNKYRIKSYR